MKTKELIKKLQELDPSGETECCVQNIDIWYVDVLPYYYDGTMQMLVRDSAKSPYYDVVGAKYLSSGEKINIVPLSIEDAIFEDVTLPVDFDTLSFSKKERYKESVEIVRQKAKDIHNSVEMDFFVEYILKRALKMTSNLGGLKEVAIKFFQENMSAFDQMPLNIKKMREEKSICGKIYTTIPSWVTRRELQWDQEFELKYVYDEEWEIIKR